VAGGAVAAGLAGALADGVGVSVTPHCRQNRAAARFDAPQAGHVVVPAGEAVSLMMGPFWHSPTVQTFTRS
jgi:hypothetical protein